MWYPIIIVVVLFLGATIYASRSQAKEGFTANNTPPDRVEMVKKTNNEIADTLNIAKYRKDYENLVIDLEEWANLRMLDLIVAEQNEGKAVNVKTVENLNQLSLFKTNLNGVMKFLDTTSK